ncbi:NACHT domain-containing protein [Azospirillum cavernae]|uniref:NACHT domain-containing protein n=1 Tax=Azospirillum cavernae TaxID=2320860 RepID=UPI0011C3A292|nr:hypothetical protein [Azospirillum cavernae]
MLSNFGGDLLSQIVMEGAPGQGKSTIVQYLCQVQRIRWLNKVSDFEKLPDAHKTSPLRLPIKVDLRDFSTWISGVNPFIPNEVISTPAVNRSLEGFLAFLIGYQSGGIDFDVNDLLEVSKLAPLFIVLDGLDEVAEIPRRRDIVMLVTKAAPRLRENCHGLKILITSRPSNFENSPGFDQNHYPILQLGSVTKAQIFKYAERWMIARNFNWREKLDLTKTLETKLDEPHIRDLARNPMQLAILLSLVHTEGPALPDKRTSLYYYYVDRFFSREAGKTAVVSQYLDLLKDIHGYVAWVLHSSAENIRGRKKIANGGKIALSDLKILLKEYLEREQQDTKIIDDIFQAMMTRVFMLVSRVEGTYQFEVQPLQEYFAARFLYDTASYSPPGLESSGTKPDRFDAIARNFYWLNVVRFFCGCFGKGELLDLADRVRELTRDPVIGRTHHPAMLAAMLLADSVFSQSPRAINEISAVLAEAETLRYLCPSRSRHRSDLSVQIPARSGGNTIVSSIFEHLISGTARWDTFINFIVFLQNNLSPQETIEWWLGDAKARLLHNKARWLRIGSALECIEHAPVHSLVENLSGDMEKGMLSLLVSHQRFDFFSGDVEMSDKMGGYILNCQVRYNQWKCAYPSFLLLPFLEVSGSINFDYSWNQREAFSAALSDFSKMESITQLCNEYGQDSFASKAWKFSEIVHRTLSGPTELPLVKIETWENLLDDAREIFGDRVALLDCAMALSEAKRGRRGRYKFMELLDLSFPIVERIRYARSQSRNAAWWKLQHGQIQRKEDALLFHFAFWLSISEDILEEMAEILADSLDSLEDFEWIALKSKFEYLVYHSVDVPKDWDHPLLPAMCSSLRLGFMASIKFPLKYAGSFSLLVFNNSAPIKREFAEFQQVYALMAAINQKISWEKALKIVRDTYNCDATFSIIRITGNGARASLPDHVIEEVVANPDAYPALLWNEAVAHITGQARKAIKPVAYTAEKEGWFVSRRR